MYVSHGQFYVFISCIAFGGASSLIFVFIYPLIRVVKYKIFKAIIEFLFFALVTILFNLYAFDMQMGDFRLYMPLGVLLGVCLGHKTFGFILAKMRSIVYNICKQKKRKKCHGVNRSKRI